MASIENSQEEIERVVPGVSPPELVSEHVARYRFAGPLVTGRQVLDLGCGAGYGSEILALAGATGVVAVDLATMAVAQARARHAAPGTRYVVADGQRLPFLAGAVDCVVAFEVLEHVADWEALVQEAHRVLRSDGILILSTPNRLTYNESRPQGANPFHVHEFDRNELRSLLASRFDQIALYDQTFTEGVLIQAENRDPPRRRRKVPVQALISPEDLNEGATHEPDYFIGVCAKKSPNELGGTRRSLRPLQRSASDLPTDSLFLSPTDFLRRLRRALSDQTRDLDEKRAWALTLDRDLRLREQQLLRVQEDLEGKVGWARDLEAESGRRGKRILELQDEVQEMVRWAKALDAQRLQLEDRLRVLTREVERLREAPVTGGNDLPPVDR